MSDRTDSSVLNGGVPLAGGVLPRPGRSDRWQPIRCGLLNLYRYDEEEFQFEAGRLLLRGDNGAGKSRVLALQLPFLLDGEVSAARVEPDGDPAKRIEWHLLMGKYPDRTGYTWIEFGRSVAGGADEYVTLGCGMRAVAGHSGLHSRWFFVTSRRIGHDLQLQSEDRRPLGRDRLEEALAGRGRILTTAEEYRHAVDDALFGLGHRYGRLLELLIRLRRPKLSQKLDEQELSNTLSDALPVLSGALVDDVAEAFRSLESDRELLAGFSETRLAVEEFLREYAVYVRIAVRRRATAVRGAHSRYEEAQRELRDAERSVESAEASLAVNEKTLERLEQDRVAAEEAVLTLQASPEMKTAADLEQAGSTARRAETQWEQAQGDVERAVRAVAVEVESALRVRRQHESVQAEAEDRLRDAAAAAEAARMVGAHGESLGITRLDASPGETLEKAGRAERSLGAAIRRRGEEVTHLRTREREVEVAQTRWKSAEEAHQRAVSECHSARDEEREAREALAEVIEEFHRLLGAWRATLEVLRVTDDPDVDAAFLNWTESREGMMPWRKVVSDQHGVAVARLSEAMAMLRQRRDVLARDAETLKSELADLERGVVAGPPCLPGRRADRTMRPGAPLWRLTDFRSDILESDRAGIEAAMESSGLLDAWVMPDGRLIDLETEDSFLVGDEGSLANPGTESLGRWLVAAPDPEDPNQREISAARVDGLLSRIGGTRGNGEHWVAADGSWRLGPLSGRWTKPRAEHVGDGSRAAARRRRMEELRQRLSDLETNLSELETEFGRVRAERVRADHELATFPTERPMVESGVCVVMSAKRVSERMLEVERAGDALAVAQDEWSRRKTVRDRDAADLGLSEELGRLDVLERALGQYERILSALWPTLRHWHASAGRVEAASESQSRAELVLEERSVRMRVAAEERAAAISRFDTLRATHGATVADVIERLRLCKVRVETIRAGLETAQQERIAYSGARATALARKEYASGERERADATRQVAIQSLELLARERLLAEAASDLESIEAGAWTVHRAVEIARKIEPTLAETPADDAVWRRRQDSIHEHVQALRDRLMSRNHPPETHQVEDVITVRCIFQGRAHTMTELKRAFDAEIQERERLLQAREREIIENHLLGEAAVELQRLIRGAEEWISTANRELAARPTGTGMRFRFVWESALEGAFASVRRSFMKTSELWSPAERSGITGFLQERIRAEQAANEQSSWRDQLSSALDYRKWHTFLVERQQEGVWRRLDRRTYGTGSGGEKALALTLPRFAAAAAHYRSARAEAPRLVMLDEAFAGIDPTMRAQCMGMLAQFDLDVVMTSEHEWGCYPTVPGLAIYHLTTSPGIDAVASTLWIWNGHERRRGRPTTMVRAEGDLGLAEAAPAQAEKEERADGRQ